MREFDKEGPRAQGVPVVWVGPDIGPALVVIDPAGAARHEDLPATWHPLAEHFQIAWCRLPASRNILEDVEDVLETLAERRAAANLVASGQGCETAVAVAIHFVDIVSAVLLVDPPDETIVERLADEDIQVHVIARSHGGDSDRVAAPMPLGHPEVVEGIVKTLANLA